MTPDDLVEKVARAMWMACDWGPMLKPYEEVREADKRVIRQEARAAIAVVLEEAAKVADEYAETTYGRDIAATIRAMEETP